MRQRTLGNITALTCIACALIVAACSDQSGSAIAGPSAQRTPGLSFSMSTTTSTTIWDFVTLAGGTGPQGNPKTFTMSGGGSVVASVIESQPNPGFQVYSKIYDQGGTAYEYERGIGICGDYGDNGACIGDDDEIGDAFWDTSGNRDLYPSLLLNLTGLASGSVVDSVTLSSLQTNTTYSVSWSSDGSTYSVMAAGTATSTTSDNLTLAVPAGAQYLRFDAGAGGAEWNNYLVQSITVTTSTSSGGGGGGVCSTNSEISSNFNGTAIPGGDYIWFNAVLNVKGRTNNEEATVGFTNQTIQMGGMTVAVPNGMVTFSASATTATTVWDSGTNTWETTVPASYSGNVFLSGLGYQVPSGGMSGGTNPVNWSGTFSGSTTGLTFQWQFGAAVYTMFGSNDAIGVKPIDANNGSAYMNSDHAGTPENYKAYVTGGARGGGGSNWTGSYSGTAAAQCQQ